MCFNFASVLCGMSQLLCLCTSSLPYIYLYQRVGRDGVDTPMPPYIRKACTRSNVGDLRFSYLCIYVQVEVFWMAPSGPARSTRCETIDAIPPPPLRLSADNITIVSIVTLNVEQDSEETRQVTASVRLVVIICIYM